MKGRTCTRAPISPQLNAPEPEAVRLRPYRALPRAAEKTAALITLVCGLALANLVYADEFHDAIDEASAAVEPRSSPGAGMSMSTPSCRTVNTAPPNWSPRT